MNGIVEVARLVNTCGEVQGRKKLQKIVHILQSLGHPFPHEFGYLHFGPYSSQLRADLDELERLGLVVEEESRTAAKGYAEYVCRAGEGLKGQLRENELDAERGWEGTAGDLNRLETPMLEAMSTILFLRDRGFEGERLKDRFGVLKPALADQFDVAMEKVEGLRRAAAGREGLRGRG